MEHTQNGPRPVERTGWPDQQLAHLPQYGQEHPGGFADPAAAVANAHAIIERQQAEHEGGPARPVGGEFVSRIDLPSGGWAELADHRKIRAKHRKRVLDRLNIDRMSQRTAGIAFDLSDGLILMMVEKWEVPYLPSIARPLDDPASLDELTIPDYDALTNALEPAREAVFPSPATPDGARTPGSPTLPAGA